MHHRYEIQGLATFYSMIYLARLLINGLFLDDTLVGLEDGSLIVPRSADAEIGLVEMESAGPQRVGLEIENPFRVKRLVLESDLEMEVGTCGSSCVSSKTDDVAGLDDLTRLDQYF